MGLIDSFLLLGLFLVGLPVAGALGWALEKVFRVGWLGRLPVLLVLVATLAGVPLALHFDGVPTVGRVVGRDERVKLSWRDGGWFSTQSLRVRFRPAHPERADPVMRAPHTDSVTLALRSTAVMFDRTPVGAIVPVTYVGFRPSIAKLSERTLGDLAREALAIGGVAAGLGLFAAVLVAVGVSGWKPAGPGGRRVRTAVFAGLAAAGLGLALRVALTSPAHGPDDPMPAAATARVEAISAIRTGECFLCDGRTEPLNQPYDVVTLAFTPLGARWPVLTADAIDDGSLRGLAVGAAVPVHYAPGVPRHARIDGAARTFEVRNGRDALLDAVLIVAALGGAYLVLTGLGRAVWRRVRRA